MVAKRHKITNVPLFKKLWDLDLDFGNFVPQKKNYVPQFLKQRDINSYCTVASYWLLYHSPDYQWVRPFTKHNSKNCWLAFTVQ
jgi:hypothetical protein